MVKAKWYKGNIHTHTTESDGDEAPEKVVRWYRQHGYDFLVLSDHNHLTLFEYAEGRRHYKKPLMIPGEEISALVQAGGRSVPIHIGGIGISRVVEPVDAGQVVSTIQANIDAILDAGGVASINHPNYKWAFDHRELRQVKGASLVEVFNGHPGTNSDGGHGKPSGEQIWDGVLSANRVIFAAATDDSHNYHDFHPKRSNPGRGWLMVRSTEFSRDAIVNAISTGEFYASTGIVLEEVEASPERISLRIEQWRDLIYQTRFTGRDGTVLAEAEGPEPSYKPGGDEGYVRATVRSSSPGERAWTQPVFLTG